MKLPSSISTPRILPDICILVSRTLSRLIEYGFLDDFEIVIPNFLKGVVDQLCDDISKTGFNNEMEKLRQLEKERKVNILYCTYKMALPENRNKLIAIEDDFILEAAILTNSILFTSDRGLKDKASSRKQPVIYIPPKFQENIKKLVKG